jgi:hypothetical protein
MRSGGAALLTLINAEQIASRDLLLRVLGLQDKPKPVRVFANKNLVQVVGQSFQFFHHSNAST